MALLAGKSHNINKPVTAMLRNQIKLSNQKMLIFVHIK